MDHFERNPGVWILLTSEGGEVIGYFFGVNPLLQGCSSLSSYFFAWIGLRRLHPLPRRRCVQRRQLHCGNGTLVQPCTKVYIPISDCRRGVRD